MLSRKDLEELTVKQLKEEAKSRGIVGYSKLSKAELISLLSKKKPSPKKPAPKKPAPKKPVKISVSGSGKTYELRPDRAENDPNVDKEDEWMARSGLGSLLQIEDASQYIVSYFDNPDGLQVALNWIAHSCKEAAVLPAVVLNLDKDVEDLFHDGESLRYEGDKTIKLANWKLRKLFIASAEAAEKIASAERAINKGKEIMSDAVRPGLTYEEMVNKMRIGQRIKEKGAEEKVPWEQYLDNINEQIKTARVELLEGQAEIDNGLRDINEAKLNFLKGNEPLGQIALDKGKRFLIGIIGLVLGDVGHWGGYIYDKTKDTVSFYDSMQTCDPSGRFTSAYSVWFETYLRTTIPFGTTVEMQGCAVCKIDPIRSEGRQPTGGFVPFVTNYARNHNYGGGSSNNILWNNIPSLELDKLDLYDDGLADQIRSVYSYDSQHHFCFMESLLFISEILARECLGEKFSSGNPPLYQIKKFIWALVHSIPENLQRKRKNKSVIFPTDADKKYFNKYFRCVFDPASREPKCIMRCEKYFDYSQTPFANIVQVLEFAYS